MSNGNTSLSPTERFWRLLKPDSKEIRNIYVYSIFNGLVSLSMPLGIQAIINLIQGGQVNTAWIVLVVFVVFGIGFMGILQIYQLRIMENIQQSIFSRAAFDFAYRIPKIRMESLYKHYAPELMNRFFDTITVQKGLSKVLIDLSLAALNIIFGLILLSFYHTFFILFSVLLIILLYVIFRLTAKKGMRTSLQESWYKYKVAHWLEELARTASTFKLAGQTDLPLKRTNDHVSGYLDAREDHFKILIQQYSLMVVFKVLVATGLLAIGGILVMEQRMNIGQFVAAEIIILLVMAAVEKLVLSLETIYDVLTALEKIGQVTDLELDDTTGMVLMRENYKKGLDVTLKDVKFCYPESDSPVLKSLTLNVEKGEKLMITGPNGSGKSTLLHILSGLYDIQEGELNYNGLTRGNLELDSLRSIIGDYFSEEQLFEGTLLENITMGKEGVKFEYVDTVIKKLGLKDFINKLPRGYDTILDPQQKKLSRSIIQKLLIARCIVDRPKLILLEDPFQHIDISERKEIIDFLLSEENEWTMVATSADPYLAKSVDRVAWMEDGKIINSGSFNQMSEYLSSENQKNA